MYTLILLSGCVKRNANIIQAESLFCLEGCDRAVIYCRLKGVEVTSEEDMEELINIFNGLELRKIEPIDYEGGSYVLFYNGTDEILMGLHGEVIGFGGNDYRIEGGVSINEEMEKYLSKLSSEGSTQME